VTAGAAYEEALERIRRLHEDGPSAMEAPFTYAKAASVSGFDGGPAEEEPKAAPRVALALSGGSYRGFLNAAGALRALQVAGLADAAHYVAGISSATWLLSSILAEPPVEGSAWPNPADIVLDASLSHPMGAMLPTMGAGREAAEVWQSAAQHVVQKAGLGLRPSVADFMGPLIAAQIQPNAYQAGGPLRLSELPEWAGLAVASPEELPGLLRENPPRSPLPIYSTLTLPRSEVEAAVDQCPVGGVTELSPLGVGHLEDFLHGLPARAVPPQLLGAEMDDGVPQGQCLRGQDNLVWVLGAASLSFSSGYDASRVREGLEQCVEAPAGASSKKRSRGQLAGSVNSEPVEQSRVACAAGPLILKVNNTEPLSRLVDPAVVPNPFKNFGAASTGGEVRASDGAAAEGGAPAHAREPFFDGLAESDVASFSEAAGCETVPMGSFVHPAREVDVVISIDSSSGDSKWPNGLSLQASYELAQNMGIPFPDFPVREDFRANTRNVREQATFLGCNQTESPLIVFLPNHATSFASNISSSDLLIPQDIVRPIVQNGYDSMLEDVLCLGCALVHAQNVKACKAAGTSLEDCDLWDALPFGSPAECDSCMEKHCWVPGGVAQSEDYIFAEAATERAARQMSKVTALGILGMFGQSGFSSI
jgi:lysophospholipase